MHICIIGTGYVGLVTGTCLAELGHRVTCVDRDEAKIDNLRAGVIPIYEPGLDELVLRNVREDRLKFTTDTQAAASDASAVFIAVGTPARKSDGHADLSYVYGVADEIAAAIKGYTVVVVKSTVPVGTGDEIERIIGRRNPNAAYSVVSNPEFLREGTAIEDFRNPDRIIVGINDDQPAMEMMADVYRALTDIQVPLLFTDRQTSELTKYAANAFLALKVTFINEIADLCEQVGANVLSVARGIGLDKRIGPRFLQPGPGYGGSCFPKDTMALVRTAQDSGTPLRLIETSLAVNEQRKRAMAWKIARACGGSLRGKRVALWGLTFKANTDDMRDAPSISIVQALLDMGATVVGYDPEGMDQARLHLPPQVYLAETMMDCAQDADVVVIVTEWAQFRAAELRELCTVVNRQVIVDLRNILRRDDVTQAGFEYTNLGGGGGKMMRKVANVS